MIAEEDVAAVLDCLRSGWLTMGPRIKAFEEELAAAAGVPHAMAVSSGAAGLQLALLAAGVQRGDGVSVGTDPSVDLLTAVRACGARPLPSEALLVEDAGGELRLEVPVTGRARCVSFGPGGDLVVGEGGAVLTHDEAVAARVRSLRSHAMTTVTWDRHRGHAETYDIVDVGFNYRMDEARAALASSMLRRLLAR